MTQSKYIDHSTHFAHIDDDIDLQLVEKTEAYARNASEHIAEAVARIGYKPIAQPLLRIGCKPIAGATKPPRQFI